MSPSNINQTFPNIDLNSATNLFILDINRLIIFDKLNKSVLYTTIHKLVPNSSLRKITTYCIRIIKTRTSLCKSKKVRDIAILENSPIDISKLVDYHPPPDQHSCINLAAVDSHSCHASTAKCRTPPPTAAMPLQQNVEPPTAATPHQRQHQ